MKALELRGGGRICSIEQEEDWMVGVRMERDMLATWALISCSYTLFSLFARSLFWNGIARLEGRRKCGFDTETLQDRRDTFLKAVGECRVSIVT